MEALWRCTEIQVFAPLSCPMTTTFLERIRHESQNGILRGCSASRSASRSDKRKAKYFKTKEQPMEQGQKLYAAKTVPWLGATPFPPHVCGPNPLRGFGGHSRP